MIYALRERIGKPELFTGRHAEISYLLRWLHNIPREISKTTALLSRRKGGKTAIMERLFNILWNENGKLIPLYIEIEDRPQWVLDLSYDYFRTIIRHYLSFKLRDPLLIKSDLSVEELWVVAEKHGVTILDSFFNTFLQFYRDRSLDLTFSSATKLPHNLAAVSGDFFVVMIDEFQYMNEYIYRDEALSNQERGLVGGYHNISESKIAPMLVSGSYVGWLRNIIGRYFIGRMRSRDINPKLSDDEGLECVFNYSRMLDIPVTGETAVLINELAHSDPFFISCIFSSDFPDFDLTDPEKVIGLLAYEIRNPGGELQKTWGEYIGKTLSKVNDRNAKRIVMFLNQEVNRNRQWTRPEIAEQLALKMSDEELEKKLKMLVSGDLISQGGNNFRYRGMQDDLLDKIFRYIFQEELENFQPHFETEYRIQMEKIIRENRSLRGRLNYYKGHITEYFIKQDLLKARRVGRRLADLVENCPKGVDFAEYESVRSQVRIKGQDTREFELDLYARPKGKPQASLVFEIKNRASGLTGRKEAEAFCEKLLMVRSIEQDERIFGVFVSVRGFTPDARKLLLDAGIMIADFQRWFGDILPE